MHVCSRSVDIHWPDLLLGVIQGHLISQQKQRVELEFFTEQTTCTTHNKTGKGSPYSITESRVPELIPVLGSQPAGDVNHKLARPAVTPATLKMAATNFAAW